MPLVVRDDPGKLAAEQGKEAGTRGGAEAERRPGYETRPGSLRRFHHCGKAGPPVGEAGQNGGEQDPRMDPRAGERRERTEPGMRQRGARLEPPEQHRIGRGERQADVQVVPVRELHQQVDVAGDERGLGGDADREPASSVSRSWRVRPNVRSAG
jgi:hypothetical protein